jgi:hypothetical protein
MPILIWIMASRLAPQAVKSTVNVTGAPNHFGMSLSFIPLRDKVIRARPKLSAPLP